MNRIDRLMAIITLLQSRKYVTSDLLEDRFNISIRTVYRDIRALSEIGIPIGFESGKGYFVVDGYFLPPVVFTTEEANALVLMESLAQKFGDETTSKSYASAMEKVRATLKGERREQVERLHDQIRAYIGPEEVRTKEYIGLIQSAITDRKLLSMTYENFEKKRSEREVEPIGLTFYGMSWHMIAWCWDRKAYRDFKVDRILRLDDTGKEFQKDDHEGLGEYIKKLE